MRSRAGSGRRTRLGGTERLPVWIASVLVCAFLAACSTSGTHKAARFEVLEGGGGFTVTEQVRFGSGARKDLENAVALIEGGEVERGIALLERITEAEPEATAAHIDLGIAYRMTKQFELAEKSLQRAVTLSPRHPVAHNELGIAQRKLGRFDEARASYLRALAIAPDFHYAQRNLAILCDVYLDDLPCAIEYYEKYAQSVPDDPQTGMWLADLRNRVGK